MLEHYLTTIAAALGVVFGVWKLYSKVKKALIRGVLERADLNRKLVTLWQFHQRRATLSAVKKGLMTVVATDHVVVYRVSQHVREIYAEKLQELKDFYAAFDHRKPEIDLYIETEEVFGQWFIDHVCEPLEIDRGECIVAAIAIMKEHHKVNVSSSDGLQRRMI